MVVFQDNNVFDEPVNPFFTNWIEATHFADPIIIDK